MSPTGDDAADCITPASACQTIGAAISKANASDTVIVAGGIYTEQLTIGKDITIQGNGESATIVDGDGVSSVFRVEASAHVRLSGITIRHGNAIRGGGIWNAGQLIVDNSTIQNNHALESGGGVENSGVLTVTESSISANSISASGLTVDGFGAGLANRGTMWLVASTVSTNTLHIKAYTDWQSRNGVIAHAEGGGIYNTGMLTATNSTITTNHALALADGGADPMMGCFDYDRAEAYGGGISSPGTASTSNVTIVSNTVGATAFCSSEFNEGAGVYGSVALASALVEGNQTAYTETPPPPIAFFGPLHDNGGSTLTHALLPGHAAIDADTCVAAIDQRGIARPQGARCDLGAYELILADISLTQRVNPQVAEPGDIVTYTLAFTNTGPGIARHVFITNDLSLNVTNPVVTSSGAPITPTTSTPYHWGVADLAMGEGGIITTTGRLSSSLEVGTPFTTIATITSTNDIIPTNNSASATVSVGVPQLQFTYPFYAVPEGESQALLTLTLSTPAPFTVTVSYTVTSGTATAGADYTSIMGTRSIASGLATVAIPIPLLNDSLDESSETVFVTLTQATGAMLGPVDAAILSILDDDGEIGPWYVAPQGNDTYDCLSTTTSCATVGQAVGRVAEGGLILISTGIYTEHLTITKTLILQGTGVTQTLLDGGGTGRVLQVAPGASLALTDLTIRNGSAPNGGGIANSGDLRLERVSITRNVASTSGAGFLNTGTATLTDCLITTNAITITTYEEPRPFLVGGGLSNRGSMTVTGCTISRNSLSASNSGRWGIASAVGGGIYNTGILTLTNSTISLNSADTLAGQERGGYDAHAFSAGGGLFNTGTAHLVNATIVANSAEASAWSYDEFYSYATSEGGGIHAQEGTLTLRNTVLAGNQLLAEGGGQGLSQGMECFGTPIFRGYTLIEDPADCTILMGTMTGNIIGQVAQLGELADNGGPTPTHALLPGSPALDAGSCDLAWDQRGRPRPGTGSTACDMGAFERQDVFVDLTLGFSVTPTVVAPDQPITYTLIYSNQGSLPAQGVLITVTVASAVGDLLIQSTRPLTPTGSIGLTWSAGTLASGASETLRIMGTLGRGLPEGSLITTTATISGDKLESHRADNQAELASTLANVPPDASDDTLLMVEDGVVWLSVLENDGDRNGDALAISILAPPRHGVATIKESTLIYTPTSNFNGEDHLLYLAGDGVLTDSARVTITVLSVNDPPVAMNDTVTTNEDRVFSLNLCANDMDVDGPYWLSTFTQPAHGAARVVGGCILTYTPKSNFTGRDTLNYTISDGMATDVASLTITVLPIAEHYPLFLPLLRHTR